MTTMPVSYLVEPERFELKDVSRAKPCPGEAPKARSAKAPADSAVLPEDLEETVRQATDRRGVDVAIESGSSIGLCKQAQKLTRKGVHRADFGLSKAGKKLSVDVVETIPTKTSLTGFVADTGQDLRDAFDSVANHPYDLKSQILMHS